MTAEEVNERFSKVIFFIPCRIAPPPYDQDGYPYAYVTDFIEKLKIPFFSLGESIQARGTIISLGSTSSFRLRWSAI